jgi:hypothetical protein
MTFHANAFNLLWYRYPHVARRSSTTFTLNTKEGFEALVDIATGEVRDGTLPRKVASIVKARELARNWELGSGNWGQNLINLVLYSLNRPHRTTIRTASIL